MQPLSITSPPGPPVPQNPHSSSPRGFTLVLVLCFLVLITGLIIAFFSSVITEYSGAKTYSAGMGTVQMADAAVHLVIGSIQEATTQGSDITWASQPGMIRAYDSNGNPVNYHKLYSSSNMVMEMKGKTLSAFDLAEDLKLSNGDAANAWAEKPSIFTDLNEPVVTTSGTHFPILDPGAAATGTSGVPDFNLVLSKIPTAAGANANPMPMPVKWIYVLRDGTLTMPASLDATGKKAQWTGVEDARQPKQSNPIVGRIAFWTDDETSKVNINTASEGAFWDTPRVYAQYDWDVLGTYQPAQHEFQRYPGHPAMTSLSAVFRDLTAEPAYAIVPRVVGGAKSSMGGTAIATGTLAFDTDRLYATVDELLFKPVLNGTSRGENNPISADVLEKAKFFITAHSSSPDLNLFGKPRVSLWPITLDPSTALPKTTPFDNLLSYCSTLNGSAYYFKRQKPNDPSNDLPVTSSTAGLNRNRMLMDYLRTLTSKNIPGFGGNFGSKYPSGDRDQILTEMFDYIRTTNLCDTSTSTATPYAPRIVNNLSSSSIFMGGGASQVIPIVDQAVTVGSGDHPRGFGRFPTVEQASLMFIGIADPDTNTTPKVPAGKIRVQAAFFLQFFDPSQGLGLTKPWFGFKVTGLDQFKWGESVLLSSTTEAALSATATMGFASSATVKYPNDNNLTNVTYFGGSLDARQYLYYPTCSGTDVGCFVSGTLDVLVTGTDGKPGAVAFSGADITVQLFPVSSGYVMSGTAVQTITITFPPGCFPLPELSSDAMTTKHQSQNATYDYRKFHVPTGSGNPGRFEAGALPLVTSKDVVRSVVATPGDIRLIAARQNIPASTSSKLYQPHPLYWSTNKFAHCLYTGRNRPYYGASGGKLFASTSGTYSGYASQYLVNDALPNTPTEENLTEWNWTGVRTMAPHVPNSDGVTQLESALPGDWDNGVSNTVDGPYINKGDEGGIPNVSTKVNVYYNIEDAALTDLAGGTYFSPNRLVPSAVEFGSLPSGVWANKPWQTLLFRPGPVGHPGLTSPADHLLLDLFHMPVVEPYAISEPMATSGRINMNYQIAPFTYINRDTGIRAVLKSEKILTVRNDQGGQYKTKDNTAVRPSSSVNFRQNIKMDATLKQFQTRFDNSDLFRSPSEICGIDLVPEDGPSEPTRASMDAYWADHGYTGDNSRERPYATVYPRLTTKSNTYTVHFRVQALKQVNRAGGDWSTWDESRDSVTSEYRGSQMIERYVDPSDTTLPDFTLPANADYSVESYPDPVTKSLVSGYKFRVLEVKRFAP